MVVTGAGRGLGRALALVAADWGADLVLLARSSGALDAVANSIRVRTGKNPVCLACDLGQPASIAAAGQAVLAASPAVDVLIHNGAPWLPGTIETASAAEILETIGAAAAGTILLTKALLPGLKASTGADILTIVSAAGLLHNRAGDSSSVFHAAKHGQSGFSDRLRDELRGYGIRVTAIYPPDFDDTDPLGPDWERVRDPRRGEKLTNREVIEAIRFALTAPRCCVFPMIVLENASGQSPVGP
jgi:short-subunit dehydrogenase